MARPLNASSYYRANPFYQQGYLPDAALRNRKEPTHYSEIPQGWEHFDPTNKKHYQKQGYYSNIAQDRIMSQQDDPSASRSRQKQYFRSLNVQDIEGASTNTLISQAVKNRMKAKEQLARRQQEQNQRDEITRMQQAMRSHEQNMRQKALQKMRSNSPINYHLAKNIQKKMSPPQKIELPYKEENTKEHQAELYRKQILKTERQLFELQNKLNSSRVNQQQQENQYENMPHRSASDLHLLPITNQPVVNSNNYHLYRESNPEYEPTSNKKNPDSYHQSIPTSKGPMSRRSPYQQSNPQKEIRDYLLLTEKQLQEPGGRPQHRRFNPTFLSYGSPTIGLAGKNIVGG